MAVTKKTVTPTPEASAIEQNEAAKAALILADEKTNRLSLAVDEADLGMDGITDSWDQGDETASAEDFSLAAIGFKRATALHEAAIRSAQAIEKSIVNVSTDLAEIVKPWIEAALPGVPISVTFVMPKGKPDILPVAYVVQTVKAETLGGGVIKGQCDVRYVRSPLHREIDGKAVEHAASMAGCRVEARGPSRSEDSYVVDTLRVKVVHGHAQSPIIAGEPTEAIASQLARNVAQALAATTSDSLQMLSGGAISSPQVTVKPNVGKVVKSEIDATGSRRTEVQAGLTYWKVGAGQLPLSMDKKLRSVVDGYVDTFTVGLGVCQAAKIVSIDSPDHSGLTNVIMLLTFASASR